MENEPGRVTKSSPNLGLSKDHRYQGEQAMLDWFAKGLLFGLIIGLIIGVALGISAHS